MTLEQFLNTVGKTEGDMLVYSGEEALEAVKQDGYALQYVKEQTEEICLKAVKQDGYALQYVKEQTEEICLGAVKQHGYALQYVNEQTEEMCLEAVRQDGYALQYVKEQTEEICLEAVKQNGYALKYVKEQTEDICLEAVKQDGDALQYVDNKLFSKNINYRNDNMETFRKDDGDKPMVQLIEPEFILGIGRVLGFGAEKYGENNWKGVSNKDVLRYEGAILRHTLAYNSGEKIDKETGLSHMYHVACNAMFLDYFDRESKGYIK